jgi:hypothetical protein
MIRNREGEVPLSIDLTKNLRVVHYRGKRIADPCGSSELPWQEYHGARNRIVRACLAHGTTGPKLECPLTADVDDPYGMPGWPNGDNDAVYWVIDDQLNHERYIYVQITAPRGVTQAWLASIVDALQEMPFWGVGISNIRRGYVIVMSTLLLVTGKPFEGCDDVASVIRAMRVNLNYPPRRRSRK